MACDLTWRWTDDAYYRAFLAAAQLDSRNLRLSLPGEPGPPLTALVSHKLTRLALPLDVSKGKFQEAVVRGCEELLTTYSGTNLGASVLVDRIRIVGSTDIGGRFSFFAVFIWESGTFGIFMGSELDLPEVFYVEKQLLLTELRHRCEALEE